MMKNNFVVFCKTYRNDLKNFKRMIKSFNKYNAQNLLMIVSVPEADLEVFKGFQTEIISIITDESYAKKYFTSEKHGGLSIGYVNQEICKLAFWESGLAENYLCVDSDAQFIRDFFVEDFMFDEKTPYTILVMDKDLSVEKHYQAYWNTRQRLIEKIYDEVGLKDKRYRTCHNMQVFNSNVLKSLKEDFMNKKNYSYKDLIKISPFEFTWYNAWFQKCQLVPEYAVEPYFKMFHYRIEYIISRLKGLTLNDYARAYVGICMNGNWVRPENEYKPQTRWMRGIYKFLNKV